MQLLFCTILNWSCRILILKIIKFEGIDQLICVKVKVLGQLCTRISLTHMYLLITILFVINHYIILAIIVWFLRLVKLEFRIGCGVEVWNIPLLSNKRLRLPQIGLLPWWNNIIHNIWWLNSLHRPEFRMIVLGHVISQKGLLHNILHTSAILWTLHLGLVYDLHELNSLSKFVRFKN